MLRRPSRNCVWCVAAFAVTIALGVRAQAPASREASVIEDASRALASFNFGYAARTFASVQAELEPSDPLWERATLGWAMSMQYLDPPTAERIAASEALYRQVAEEASDPRFVARATLALGRLAELSDFRGDPPNHEAAAAFYRAVYENMPELPAADEALLRHAGLLAARFDAPESVRAARRLLENRLAEYGNNDYAALMHELLATIALFRKEYSEAITHFRRADELGLVEPNLSARTWWLIARLSETQASDVDTGVAYYTRIILEAPYSGLAFEAQLALKRLKQAHPDRPIEVPELVGFDRAEEQAIDG
ncbi:MAG: hypothetical protein AAGF84_03390 [Planctomycetota bacterium]